MNKNYRKVKSQEVFSFLDLLEDRYLDLLIDYINNLKELRRVQAKDVRLCQDQLGIMGAVQE